MTYLRLKKQCLTVDTRPINDLGPGKFRKQADNGQEQICYYNRGKSDTHFNSFLAKRKQTSQKNDIRFSIVKIITSSNNLDVEYISLNNELKNICDGNSHSKLQQIGRGDSDRGGSSIEKRAGDRNRQAKQQGSERRRVSKKPRFLSK